MRRFLTLPFALVLAIMVGGCRPMEDGPTSPPSSMPEQIVGTWTVQSVTLNGVNAPLADALNWGPATVTRKMTIDQNGVYSSRDLDGSGAAVYTESGTVSVDGQRMTVIFNTAEGQPIDPVEYKSFRWTTAGNILSLTIDEVEPVTVIRFTK